MDGFSALIQPFADILAPLVKFIAWLCPKFYLIPDGQLGVILTFGKVRGKNQQKEPGFYFCWPCQEMEVCQADGGYISLDYKNVQTKDGGLLVVRGAIELRVEDVRKAMLLTEELEPLIAGICQSEIRDFVRKKEQATIIESPRMDKDLLKHVNKRAEEHGVVVEDIMITDLRPHEITLVCDTIREVTGHALDRFKPIKPAQPDPPK